MNNLDIQLGGHRPQNDDIMFVQAAIKEALRGIGLALGNNSILSGCELSQVGAGPSFQLTEGFVFINDEVFFVPAQTYASGAPTTPVWVIEDVVNANIGTILYADGQNKGVHRVRRLLLQSFVGQSNIGSANLTIIRYNEPAQVLTAINGWGTGALPVSSPRYIKEGRWVHLYGDITYSGSFPATPGPFFVLPPGYRPLYNGFYSGIVGETFASGILDTAGVAPDVGWIYIDTNGNCFADPNAIASPKALNLNNVRFKIA